MKSTKPKKRKIAQSQKSRTPISSIDRARQVMQQKEQEAYEAEQNRIAAILNKTHVLSMEFTIEALKKKFDAFHVAHDFDPQAKDKSIFIPEFVTIDAYNQHDLVIALQMQHVDCVDWLVGVDTHFFDYDTEEIKTIPFQAQLRGISYLEINTGSKAAVLRDGGFKTRWKGLDRELEDEYKAQNLAPGFKAIRTEMKIVGECKFKHYGAYREYQFFKSLVEKGTLIEYLEVMSKQLQKDGLLDDRFQPIGGVDGPIPLDAFSQNVKQYEQDKKAIQPLLRLVA